MRQSKSLFLSVKQILVIQGTPLALTTDWCIGLFYSGCFREVRGAVHSQNYKRYKVWLTFQGLKTENDLFPFFSFLYHIETQKNKVKGFVFSFPFSNLKIVDGEWFVFLVLLKKKRKVNGEFFFFFTMFQNENENGLDG